MFFKYYITSQRLFFDNSNKRIKDEIIFKRNRKYNQGW